MGYTGYVNFNKDLKLLKKKLKNLGLPCEELHKYENDYVEKNMKNDYIYDYMNEYIDNFQEDFKEETQDSRLRLRPNKTIGIFIHSIHFFFNSSDLKNC